MSGSFFRIMTLTGLVLLAGCEKFGNSRAIRFSAVSTEKGLTKTVYSGATTTESAIVYERINWVSGDQIRMASDKAHLDGNESVKVADYHMDVQSDPTKAKAIPFSNGLVWGSGAHQFSAVYPNTATLSLGSATGMTISSVQDVSESRKTVTATNTTFAPDMSSAWMLAHVTGVSEGVSNFDMDFYPAYTAFEFTIQSQSANTLTIKSFELTSASSDLWGTFGATLAVDGASTYSTPTVGTAASRKISVSFGTGVAVTNTQSLTFTVFALPKDLPDLTIRFNYDFGSASMTKSLQLKRTSPDEFITFAGCRKHRIYGLALPNGGLVLNLSVSEWTEGADPYNFVSPVASSLKCLDAETYRRYDTDGDLSTWDGSHIAVSFGYMNPSDEIIITDNPAEFQTREHTLLRPAYAPILELATNSDPSQVMQLQLDNPHFKFIQYGNSGGPTGGIDLSVRDHSKTDRLEIVSGAGVKTFFSVVPVEQFAIDAPDVDKICRVSLLSVSPGTIHELSFNQTDAPIPTQALPGESSAELRFLYFGPSVYPTTGTEVTP